MATAQPFPSSRVDAGRRRGVRNHALALIRLAIVIGVHGAVMAAFLGAPTQAPELPTQTIIVSLIAPTAPAPVAKPTPPPAPMPVVKPPAPKPPEPIAKPRPRPVVKPASRPPPRRPTPAAPPNAIRPPAPAVERAPQTTAAELTATTVAETAVAKTSETVAVRRGAPAPVSRARFDAAYLENPEPVYPRMSRRRNEHGRVLLRVHVNADGSAGDVRLHQSSGHRRLDEAARKTVARWRFVPAKRGDTAVASWLIVPIEFKLEDA